MARELMAQRARLIFEHYEDDTSRTGNTTSLLGRAGSLFSSGVVSKAKDMMLTAGGTAPAFLTDFLKTGEIEATFNPASLSVSVSARNPVTTQDESSGDNSVSTIGNIQVGGTMLLYSAAEGDPTVHQKISFLLNQLRKQTGQRVSFLFGQMHFSGTLESLSAVYKRFDSSGMPTAGEIRFQILTNETPAQLEKKLGRLGDE